MKQTFKHFLSAAFIIAAAFIAFSSCKKDSSGGHGNVIMAMLQKNRFLRN